MINTAAPAIMIPIMSNTASVTIIKWEKIKLYPSTQF